MSRQKSGHFIVSPRGLWELQNILAGWCKRLLQQALVSFSLICMQFLLSLFRLFVLEFCCTMYFCLLDFSFTVVQFYNTIVKVQHCLQLSSCLMMTHYQWYRLQQDATSQQAKHLCNNNSHLPVAEMTANLHPLWNPGSMPRMDCPRTGGVNSSCFKFDANIATDAFSAFFVITDLTTNINIQNFEPSGISVGNSAV